MTNPLSKPAGHTPTVNYDPNTQWATHTFAVTFCMWDYSLTVNLSMDGNCRGLTVMESAIESYADTLFEDQGENPTLILRRPAAAGSDEDTLECSPDDDDIEEWLKGMCVGIVLIGHEKEIRAQRKEAA